MRQNPLLFLPLSSQHLQLWLPACSRGGSLAPRRTAFMSNSGSLSGVKCGFGVAEALVCFPSPAHVPLQYQRNVSQKSKVNVVHPSRKGMHIPHAARTTSTPKAALSRQTVVQNQKRFKHFDSKFLLKGKSSTETCLSCSGLTNVRRFMQLTLPRSNHHICLKHGSNYKEVEVDLVDSAVLPPLVTF